MESQLDSAPDRQFVLNLIPALRQVDPVVLPLRPLVLRTRDLLGAETGPAKFVEQFGLGNRSPDRRPADQRDRRRQPCP